MHAKNAHLDDKKEEKCKLFKCNLCDEAFSLPNVLIKHLENQHGIREEEDSYRHRHPNVENPKNNIYWNFPH